MMKKDEINLPIFTMLIASLVCCPVSKFEDEQSFKHKNNRRLYSTHLLATIVREDRRKKTT
jgi:hypothetical protein